jgi:hypothetical protein
LTVKSKKNVLNGLLVVGLLACLPASASVVTDWNALAVACANRAGGPAPVVDLALVQAAVHDAVQSIERRYHPYRESLLTSGAESTEAAAVAAAWRVLSDTRICPASAQPGLLAAYTAFAATADPAGLAIGLEIGARMLGHYRSVPNPAPVFGGNFGPGEWRPTAPGNGTMVAAYLATIDPYVLLKPSQFRPQPPPPLTSQRYQREYDEVKSIGAVGSHSTTPDCGNPTTDAARFWSGNFNAQWNQVSRDLANSHALSIGDAARLLALVNIAAADTVIAVWESKIHYNFWRPITAIREGDDATWTPFIQSGHFPAGSQTPAYPDYVSGANGITGAFLGVLRLYFGTDDVTFQVNRAVPASVLTCTNPRTFTRLSDAEAEVVEARIVLGIHFRSADTEARRLGERVAHWAFHEALQSLPPGRAK